MDGQQEHEPKRVNPVFDRALRERLLQHGRLERPGINHGRSVHLNAEQVAELIPTPSNAEYSLKGLPTQLPFVNSYESRAGQIKFRIEGLVSKAKIDIATERQKLLLEHGLPTEKYVKVYDLAEVPDNDRFVIADQPSTEDQADATPAARTVTRVPSPPIAIEDWKREVLEQLDYKSMHSDEEYLNKYRAKLLVSWNAMTADDIEKVKQYIHQTEYAVVLREMPVEASVIDIQSAARVDSGFQGAYKPGEGFTLTMGARDTTFHDMPSLQAALPDLVQQYQESAGHTETLEEATGGLTKLADRMESLYTQDTTTPFETQSTYASEQMLAKAFAYINVSERFTTSPLLPAGGFDASNPEHVKVFFTQFAPTYMADYLSDLHGLGVGHGYAHGQNWKMGLFLMDLDSMKTLPADPGTASEEKRNDVQRSIEAIDSLYSMQTLSREQPEIAPSFLAAEFLRSGIDPSEQAKLYAMRQEAICQFLASYWQKQGMIQSLEDIQTQLSQLRIKNPFPESAPDYAPRIQELLEVK